MLEENSQISCVRIQENFQVPNPPAYRQAGFSKGGRGGIILSAIAHQLWVINYSLSAICYQLNYTLGFQFRTTFSSIRTLPFSTVLGMISGG
jgi:hypothetical protein